MYGNQKTGGRRDRMGGLTTSILNATELSKKFLAVGQATMTKAVYYLYAKASLVQ